MTLDPGEYEVADLGKELMPIEDVEELEAILAAEKEGQNRDPVLKLIQSRIDLHTPDEADDGDIDPTELTVAELGNAIRSVEDPDRLAEVLAAEEAGKDRDSAKRLIRQRIDSVSGSEESEADEQLSPEEKHPDLNHPTADKRHVRALADGTFGDMWVYCETQAGDLVDVSREMLGKARELMDTYNEEYDADERVVAVLIGADVAKHADECIALGADVVVHTEDDRLERFLHRPYTGVFCDMAREDAEWRDYDEPRYVVFPATNNGRDLSAQVQAELDSGLASDCSDLYIESAVIANPVKVGSAGDKKTFDRVLHMKRPDFSGFEYSTILCIDNPGREFHPQGASVIPGSFPIPEADEGREGLVVEHAVDLPDEWFTVRVTDHDVLDEGVDLTGHDVIVAVGRGIGRDPTRGMELAIELAEQFDDAEVGVTRGIVTGSYDFDGHVERYTREERQIGETGQVVAPKLYIAAGVSGAVQHKVGMDESDVIVAINTDPEARIRDFSDYFIEGDLFEVLPRFIDALESGELDVAALADGGEASD